MHVMHKLELWNMIKSITYHKHTLSKNLYKVFPSDLETTPNKEVVPITLHSYFFLR